MKDVIPEMNPPLGLELWWTPLVVLFFVLVVAWAYRKNGKSLYARAERLPLEDD